METANRVVRPDRLILIRLLLFVLFINGAFLHAQNAAESSSYAIKTEEGIVLYQTIVFPAVPDTSYYEIEIEQFSATWIPLQQLKTEENQFEVSLKAGNYRYRVTVYNEMGIWAGRSNWQNFTILPAIQPEAETYQPFYGLYHEMSGTSGTITVSGNNFSSESEFALVKHKRNPDWSGLSMENQNDVLFPDQVVVSGNQATLHFNPENLKTGDYDIFIRNPGGLWTIIGTVRAGHKSQIDLTLSFGYSPMFALFDLDHSYQPGHSGNKVDRFNPAGYYFRLGFIPLKTRIGNFGLELNMNMMVDNYLGED